MEEIKLSTKEVKDILVLFKEMGVEVPKEAKTLALKGKFIFNRSEVEGLPVLIGDKIEVMSREEYLAHRAGSSVEPEIEGSEEKKTEVKNPTVMQSGSDLKVFEGQKVLRVTTVSKNLKPYREIVDVTGQTKLISEEEYKSLSEKQQ